MLAKIFIALGQEGKDIPLLELIMRCLIQKLFSGLEIPYGFFVIFKLLKIYNAYFSIDLP